MKNCKAHTRVGKGWEGMVIKRPQKALKLKPLPTAKVGCQLPPPPEV